MLETQYQAIGYYIDIDRDGHDISRFGGQPRELYFPKGLYFPPPPPRSAQHSGKISLHTPTNK